MSDIIQMDMFGREITLGSIILISRPDRAKLDPGIVWRITKERLDFVEFGYSVGKSWTSLYIHNTVNSNIVLLDLTTPNIEKIFTPTGIGAAIGKLLLPAGYKLGDALMPSVAVAGEASVPVVEQKNTASLKGVAILRKN